MAEPMRIPNRYLTPDGPALLEPGRKVGIRASDVWVDRHGHGRVNPYAHLYPPNRGLITIERVEDGLKADFGAIEERIVVRPKPAEAGDEEWIPIVEVEGEPRPEPDPDRKESRVVRLN